MRIDSPLTRFLQLRRWADRTVGALRSSFRRAQRVNTVMLDGGVRIDCCRLVVRARQRARFLTFLVSGTRGRTIAIAPIVYPFSTLARFNRLPREK